MKFLDGFTCEDGWTQNKGEPASAPLPAPEDPRLSMDWPCPSYPPDLKGYLSWIFNPMGGNVPFDPFLIRGVPEGVDELEGISNSLLLCALKTQLDFAKKLIPCEALCVFGKETYTLLVYNAAFTYFLSFMPGAAADKLRSQYGIKLSLTGGIIQSGGDQGTSGSLFIPAYLQEIPAWAAMMGQSPFGAFVYSMLSQMGATWTVLV